jgi:mannose-6-phosphate isomerase
MKNSKLQSPLFFERNRVFRVYEGGKLFHDFFGDEAVDGNFPEEWIASKVKALNKETRHPDEGLSRIRGGEETFASLLTKYPEEMTGGNGFDILVKILDSAVRLPAQTHPDPAFSRKHFASNHGKTECWVILATRPGAKLFYGFKEGVTEAELRQAVEKSELPGDAFSGLLQEVEARAGDVWLIPARVAHAIGAGCLILEVQEPTDFTIQPERWCDRYQLSDQEMYLGLDKEVALSCFDLRQAGPSVLARGKKLPQANGGNNGCQKEVLIAFSDTPCFAVNRYTLKSACVLRNLAVYVVTKGEGELVSLAGRCSLSKGTYFFVPFAAKKVIVSTQSELEMIECLPPVSEQTHLRFIPFHPAARQSVQFTNSGR